MGQMYESRGRKAQKNTEKNPHKLNHRHRLSLRIVIDIQFTTKDQID